MLRVLNVAPSQVRASGEVINTPIAAAAVELIEETRRWHWFAPRDQEVV